MYNKITNIWELVYIRDVNTTKSAERVLTLPDGFHNVTRTKQNKTKQKTKQNKTKQNKKQNKTKQDQKQNKNKTKTKTKTKKNEFKLDACRQVLGRFRYTF